jgi:uncharacterized membrane protein
VESVDGSAVKLKQSNGNSSCYHRLYYYAQCFNDGKGPGRTGSVDLVLENPPADTILANACTHKSPSRCTASFVGQIFFLFEMLAFCFGSTPLLRIIWMLFVVCCLLFVVCCLLFVVLLFCCFVVAFLV